MKKTVDLGKSVHARLLNTLRNYFFERFLYRLQESKLSERFVLKGAMLFRVWAEQPYRATMDLDLLSRGDNSADAVKKDIAAVCATKGLSARVRDCREAGGDRDAGDPEQPYQGLLRHPLSRRSRDVRRQQACGSCAAHVRASSHADSRDSAHRARRYVLAEPERPAHVRAFARRARITTDVASARALAQTVREFLWPVLQALQKREDFVKNWPPGGPWA